MELATESIRGGDERKGWILLQEDGPRGSRLVATKHFEPGDVVGPLTGTVRQATPTRTTIQIGTDLHLDGLGDWAFLNHSCNPTVRVDTVRMLVVAARRMAPGDELAFFYPETEVDMASPFACRCEEDECIEVVRGAIHVDAETLAKYPLSPHVREALAGRARGA